MDTEDEIAVQWKSPKLDNERSVRMTPRTGKTGRVKTRMLTAQRDGVGETKGTD